MQLLQTASWKAFLILRLHTSHVEHPIVVARVRIGTNYGTVIFVSVLVVLVVGVVSVDVFAVVIAASTIGRDVEGCDWDGWLATGR